MQDLEQNFGKKIEFDPLWKGPLQIERKKTDIPFLIGYGVFLVFWLSIGIYAYSSGNFNGSVSRYLYKRQIYYSKYYHHQFSTSLDLSRDSIPSNQDYDLNNIFNYSNSDGSTDNFVVVKNIAVGFTFFGILVSIIYIILLRWFANYIVFGIIFLICSALFAVISSLTYMYISIRKTEIMIALVPLALIFILIVIFVCICKKKISIACEVIRQSCRVVLFFPSSLLFPILPCLFFGTVWAFGISVLFYLRAIPQIGDQSYAHIDIFHMVNAFGILWSTLFIIAFTQIILSGSFATWYWAADKRHIPNYVILTFMAKATKYHLGTIAFGSLILSVFKIVKILMYFFSKIFKGRYNPCCCGCCCCCFHGWFNHLFEYLIRFLEYINSNAYIMCTIHGTEYWQSAKDAFNLLMRNIIKVLVINTVTEVILILGQFIVISLSVLATWGYCNNNHYVSWDLDSVMLPAIGLVGASTFFITVFFFMILRTSINTIFLCVMEDFERNDGSEERPYLMSFELRKLLLT